MGWWFTPDVTSWLVVGGETRGLRPKSWVVDSHGQQWLRKEALPKRPSELAVEAFTLELARRCGYEVALGHACTWLAGAELTRGFVSRKFHDATEDQATGGELIANELMLPEHLDSSEAEGRRRVLTTLEVTRSVLEAEAARYGVELIRPFLAMLVFDAWIGNGDRHSGNWAILVGATSDRATCRFAPIYDTAGCLLAEMLERSLETKFASGMVEAAISRYVDGCRSGFGDGEQVAGIDHRALLAKLVAWPEWLDVAAPLIACFSGHLETAEGLLDEIPSEWLSARRKSLIRSLLAARVKMLLELLP